MYNERSDRDIIQEDIRKRLVNIKGIGPEKAERGSDAVMEYLDSLVSSQQENPCNLIPGRRDEDGIEMIKRPDNVKDRYNYLYWSPDGRGAWLHENKPVDFYDILGHYTQDGIEGEEKVNQMHVVRSLLSETRIVECNPRDRIVRLVD